MDWLRLAEKIHAYRRDVLSEELRAKLEAGIAGLRAKLKQKAPVAEIEATCVDLEPIMQQAGGSFFPRSTWAENIEMVLVAALVVIAIRSFFFQPFKIPTNSMYPTYNGITTQTYLSEEAKPSRLGRVARIFQLGAGHRSYEAPADGELIVPLPDGRPSTLQRGVRGRLEGVRRLIFFPGTEAVYTFYIGNEPIDVRVPVNFPIEDLVQQLAGEGARRAEHPRLGSVLFMDRSFEAGEFAFAFDILTGDQLFVDRLSYHFIRPKPGHPVVFRTDEIELMSHAERGKYYIKRLVGVGGDQIEIDPPQLLRNGSPIEGAAPFDRNARQEGEYPGYVFMSGARFGGHRPIDVPADSYFVMGDNSTNSADSRQWGFVPKEAVVGRAFFIYYPFSHRWGRSE